MSRAIKKLIRDKVCLEDCLPNVIVNLKNFELGCSGDASYRVIAFRKTEDLKYVWKLKSRHHGWVDDERIVNEGDAAKWEFREGLWVFPERYRDIQGVSDLFYVGKFREHLLNKIWENKLPFEIGCFNDIGKKVIFT
ncbi:hypothetical protein CL616_02015 [archaeon]|nr:hypothetical protein [archaeon]|tara:strand:- start:280 stop:690 length:411 start_codon:yes stop_codon:yes gene_type:complete